MKQINLNRAGSKVILWGLIIALLVFTATRTLHFLMQTFPPDQQYIGYLALAAFDIGVLGWLYYATNAAEGTLQRVVAYGMIFVCAAGVLATTIADMLIVSARNGMTAKMSPDVATVALWAVIIVISLNVFSGILTHLFDPAHQRHMAVESARDRIHAATLAAIEQRTSAIAPEIADRIAEYWQSQTVAEMVGHIPNVRVSEVSTSTPALAAPRKDDGLKNGRRRTRTVVQADDAPTTR